MEPPSTVLLPQRSQSTAALLARNPRLAAAALFNAIGAFLFGLDNSYIGPLEEMHSFQQLMNNGSSLAPIQAGLTTGIFSCTAFAVSFPAITAFLLERFGRRRGIGIGGSLCLVAIVLQASSRSLHVFWLGRAVAGGAIGLLTCVVPLFNGELASAELRGALVGLFQVGVNAGMCVAALIADAVRDAPSGWALSIWFQGLFALCLVLGSICMPESPRWLCMERRPEEARASLVRMRRDKTAEQVNDELAEIVRACETERRDRDDFRWRTFCSGYSLRVVLVGVAIQLLQNFGGVLVFVWWSVKIFGIVTAATGVSAFRLNTLQNVVNLVATVPGTFLVDRVGRRKLLLASSLGCLAANLTIMLVGILAVPAACARAPSPEVCADTPPAVGWVIVLAVYAFWAAFAFGWGMTAWALCGEIFPQAYRSTAIGFCVMTNQGVNFVIGFFMPSLLRAFGFWSFGISVVCSMLAVAFAHWIPETKGCTLEAITALFERKLGARASSGSTREGGCTSAADSQAQMKAPSSAWCELVEPRCLEYMWSRSRLRKLARRRKRGAEKLSCQSDPPTPDAAMSTTSYPASKISHFDLVPGNCNTTTKDPMVRPPDMRLVTALASKGPTLAEALKKMNMGPSGRETKLQQLTTRDVLMLPDLFEPSSGFVMPPDPWDKGDGTTKTIYQRLVEEIHHAGKAEASYQGNGQHEKAFSTDKDGMFKDDAGGLFKAWHKTTARAAGDGLADSNGRDGNGHLIVNDRDSRWQQAQARGEAPMYDAVHGRIEEFFKMRIQGKVRPLASRCANTPRGPPIRATPSLLLASPCSPRGVTVWIQPARAAAVQPLPRHVQLEALSS